MVVIRSLLCYVELLTTRSDIITILTNVLMETYVLVKAGVVNKSEMFNDEESRNLAEKWKNNDFENSSLITTVRHPFARLGKF